MESQEEPNKIKCPQCEKSVSKDFPYCEFCTFPIGKMQTSSDPDFVQKEIKAEKKRCARDKKVDAGPFVRIRRGSVIFFGGLAFFSFTVIFLALNFHDFSNLVKRHQIDEENKYPTLAIVGFEKWREWRKSKVVYEQQYKAVEKELKEKWTNGGYFYNSTKLSSVYEAIKKIKKEISNNNIDSTNFASIELNNKYNDFKLSCEPNLMALYEQHCKDIEKEIKNKWTKEGYEYDAGKLSSVQEQIKKLREEISKNSVQGSKLADQDLTNKYNVFIDACKPKGEQLYKDIEKEIKEKWCFGGYQYDKNKLSSVEKQIISLKDAIFKKSAVAAKTASKELEKVFNDFKASCKWQFGLSHPTDPNLVSGEKEGTWAYAGEVPLGPAKRTEYLNECKQIVDNIDHILNYAYQYAYQYDAKRAQEIKSKVEDIKAKISTEKSKTVNGLMADLRNAYNSFNNTKKWLSGVKNAKFEHVISTNTPEQWVPDSDKWEFVHPGTDDLTVKEKEILLTASERAWYKGQFIFYTNSVINYQKGPYEYDLSIATKVFQKAALLELKSEKASGRELYNYLSDLKNTYNDFCKSLKWKPGVRHIKYIHVISGTVEGQWYPEQGYEWDNPNGQIGPVHKIQPCNKCNGQRYVTTYVKCKTCNGSGKVKESLGSLYNLASDITKTASGVDIGRVNNRYVKCSSCNGKGRIQQSVTCDRCNGTGRYTK